MTMKILQPKTHGMHQKQFKEGSLRSEEHTSELQSHSDLVCRLLLEKKNVKNTNTWRINKKLLNNQEITEEIRGNQKIPRNK